MSIKRAVNDLALLGGPQSYAELRHVGRPNMGDKRAILARFEEILDRRWFTNDGPCVRELEYEVARYLGVRNCVAVANGTLGLELAVRALGLSGEIIVPSFTFVATAHAVRWMGYTPVFADVTRETHSLDVAHVERLITPRTTGILGVHLWGIPCDVSALQALADRKGLKLLFDAAHAFGCSLEGVMVGNFGAAEVFSFHATKFFNTFEGGAIATNDDELARECRRIRNFGFAGYDNVTSLGTNAKMSEVCAAMGLESLRSIDEFVVDNRRNHGCYARLLEDIPGLALVHYSPTEANNFQYVVVLVDAARAGLTRDELVKVLHAENVFARRYFTPGTHAMAAYAEGALGVDLPVTEWLAESIMCLPTGTAINTADVEQICSILRIAVAHASTVRESLQESSLARSVL